MFLYRLCKCTVFTQGSTDLNNAQLIAKLSPTQAPAGLSLALFSISTYDYIM